MLCCAVVPRLCVVLVVEILVCFCHVGFQLMVTILSGLIGLNAVQRAVMAFRCVTDPASIPHRPTVAVTARALEI